jgi:hypothetical protein
VPDLVKPIEFALHIDEALDEGVVRGVEIAVGQQKASLGQEGVADALILDDQRVYKALAMGACIGASGPQPTVSQT